MRITLILFYIFFVLISLPSCLTSKPQPYFNVLDENALSQENEAPEIVVRKGDIIGITILSDNPEATLIYNQAASTGAPGASSQNSGYLVNDKGEIYIHALGNLHVEGLTKGQLNELIMQKVLALGVLQNPYCVIKFLNYRITVLGEVKNPGYFTIPTEKISILEALGMAGDFTSYGLKNNVLVIREKDGKRNYGKLDFTKQDIFSSPYFYLQQNDVVVVAADKNKTTAGDEQTLRYVTIAVSLVSLIAITVSLFK